MQETDSVVGDHQPESDAYLGKVRARTVGSTEQSAAANFYASLAKKGDANALFAPNAKVRQAGPSYPQIISALIEHSKSNR
jgi:hypothetical protein